MTIIDRKALLHWGEALGIKRDLPDDLAFIVDDPWRGGRKIVTWSEVMENRRDRQAKILRHKRHVEPWRAVKLWVAYFNQDLFGGWHGFIEDWRGRNGRIWIDRDGKGFIAQAMEMFPVGLPLGSWRERWEEWKPAFAKKFSRGKHDRKPRGVVFLWKRGQELAWRPQ